MADSKAVLHVAHLELLLIQEQIKVLINNTFIYLFIIYYYYCYYYYFCRLNMTNCVLERKNCAKEKRN